MSDKAAFVSGALFCVHSESTQKKEIPVHKMYITNNTDEKELVECWTLLLPYNYKLW